MKNLIDVFSQKHRSRSQGIAPPALLILFVGCLCLFLWQLDTYSLINVTEARQAEIARQIHVTQNWITPMYNGEPYFDKPALLHWLIAVGFGIFGLHEWVVRLPSALAAIALIVATYVFFQQVTTPRQAYLTATMLAANPFTWALGRIGYHDMLLVFFMTVALYSWYWAFHVAPSPCSAHWGYLTGCGSLALAVLAKGPLALVLCGLVIITYGVWRGNIRQIWRALPWKSGTLLFCGIAGPWYVLMLWVNGWDFLQSFLGASNVDRFISVNQNQWGPWYYYLLMVSVLFFPWIVMIPRLLLTAIHRAMRAWRSSPPPQAPAPPTEPLVTFMAIWFVVVLIFMSVAATKLSWYLYPGIPALAYLCVVAWHRQISTPERWLRLELTGMALGYGLVAIALLQGWGLEKTLLASLTATGLRWTWSLLLVIALLIIGLSTLYLRAGWAWWVGVFTFGAIALSAAHTWMPLLDRQVLDQQLVPIARSLGQQTCNTCEQDLPATLELTFPSLNFYSGIDKIQRFKQTCEIPGALAETQRLLLVATDDSLQDNQLQFQDRYLSTHSGRYNLLIIPAGDPALKQFQASNNGKNCPQ